MGVHDPGFDPGEELGQMDHDELLEEVIKLRAEILDLRQLLGPYSTVKIALKKYQEAADEATTASLQIDALKNDKIELRARAEGAEATAEHWHDARRNAIAGGEILKKELDAANRLNGEMKRLCVQAIARKLHHICGNLEQSMPGFDSPSMLSQLTDAIMSVEFIEKPVGDVVVRFACGECAEWHIGKKIEVECICKCHLAEKREVPQQIDNGPKQCICGHGYHSSCEVHGWEAHANNLCHSCGWDNGPNHGCGSRVMYTVGKVVTCGECLPTTR